MRSLLILAFLVQAGCVSAHAVRLGDLVHEARPATAPVPIYAAAADVPGAFTKVAIVLADGDDDASWERVFAELRTQARQVGAEALILQAIGHHSAGEDGACCGDKTVQALAIRRTPERQP